MASTQPGTSVNGEAYKDWAHISVGHVLGSITDVSRIHHHTLHVPPVLCISDGFPAALDQQ